MTPIAAQYRSILEENGWTFLGECRVCSGTKWHYAYGNVVRLRSGVEKVYDYEIKTSKDRDSFSFYVKGKHTRGPANIRGLVDVLKEHGAIRKQPA